MVFYALSDMSKRKMIPIMLTAFMMISLYFISACSPLATTQTVILNESSITISANLTGQTEFTILLDGNSNINLINLALNGYTHIARSGSDLATFSVPTSDFPIVSSILEGINGTEISDYFYLNSTQPVNPGISYSNVTPYQAAPFPYSPSDIAGAYDFNGAYASHDYGQGVTIAIVDAYGDPNLQYDLYSFDHISGLPAVNLSVNYPEGQPPSVSTPWAIETASDVEWAHAMAPEANISLYVSPNSNLESMMNITSMIVNEKLASIISFSWGIPEVSVTGSEMKAFSSILNKAASYGISVVAASGDLGAFDGEPLPSVNFPASDPSVLSVGGTSLAYFDNIMYQYAWGGNISGTSYGSGGGYSNYFSVPPYQEGIKNITDRRGVPDVAMDANNETGVYSIIGGGEYRIGGTSIGAPIWSAVIALIDSKYGIDLGNPDYLFYRIASTPLYNQSFSQIVSGSNGFYSASPGWNPVTGLGTPIVWNLILDSGKILQPFGTLISMYGNNPNFTGLSANVSVSEIPENLSFASGLDYFYVSLHDSQEQYVDAGFEFVSGQYRTLQIIKNYGILNESYGSWNSYGLKSGPLSISLSYSGGSVYFNSSSGDSRTYAFLNFSGSTTPAIGDMIRGSEENYSIGYAGTFANLTETGVNSSGNLTPESLSEFSGVGGKYDSIGVNVTNDSYEFGPHLPLSLKRNASPGREIEYTDSFSYPSTVTMYLTNFNGGVTWNVNGINSSSGVDFFGSHGGIYNVTAYSSSNLTPLAYREIIVPEIKYEKLSVNSSIIYDLRPDFEATVDNALEISSHGNTNITVMNGSNGYSVVSTGFNSTSLTIPYKNYLNITLGPRPVAFSIFVFDAGSRLMIDNSSLAVKNGTFAGEMYVERPIDLNVTSPGYRSYNTTISPVPGSLYQTQISLVSNGSKTAFITGELLDANFNFHISGSRVYLNGTLEGYSNQSGYFEFYATPGVDNLSVIAPLYKTYSEPLHLTNNTGFLKIYLSPEDVSINSKVILSITRSFPFLFYFAYVSWTVYKGGNFSHYELFQSPTSSFYNSTTTNIFTRSDGYTFLDGVTPLHKTYVALELYLNNSQEYSTGYVSITYDNAVYFIANFAILVGILVYLYIMLDLLYLRKRRREWGLR